MFELKDKFEIKEINNINNYDGIIISPGPGTPEDKKYFGICSEVIKDIGPTTPILGVCLGHQGIIDAFGGKVTNAGCVRHGKTSPVKHTNSELFKDVKNPFRATRYHSLVGDKTIIPDILEVTATANDDGEIMAIKHKEFLIQGTLPNYSESYSDEVLISEHLAKRLLFKVGDTGSDPT